MDFPSSKRTDIMVTALVITFIIFLYSLVPPPSIKAFLPPVTQYYYPLLTKGFLSGHLSLPVQPSHALLNLSNPYDPDLNNDYRQMFDASLYKGKYYLYFGPLPLLFFIPYTLLTGKFASEYFGVFFFLALGFGVSFYLLSKIKIKYFPQISNAQLILAGLVLGVSNNAMYLIGRPSVYEVAIASAFCFMNLSLLFLFNIFSNNFKIKDIVLFSLCLSLCVAGRPHFVLVCMVMVPLVFAFLVKLTPRNRLFKSSMALFVPLMSVGIFLALYNYLRFDSIWEFGQSYQIADRNPMLDTIFDINYRNWIPGFYYYFFSRLGSTDWVYVSHADLTFMKFIRGFQVSPLLTSTYHIGYIRSVFTTAPVALFILALPTVYFKNKDPQVFPLLRFITITFVAMCVIVLYLVSIGNVVQRYVTDFLPYLIMLAIIIAWFFEKSCFSPLTKKIFQCVFVIAEFASLGLAFTV